MPEDCKVKKDSMVPREIKGNQAFKDKQEAKERWVKRASKVGLITRNIQLSAEDGVMFLGRMLFKTCKYASVCGRGSHIRHQFIDVEMYTQARHNLGKPFLDLRIYCYISS